VGKVQCKVQKQRGVRIG